MNCKPILQDAGINYTILQHYLLTRTQPMNMHTRLFNVHWLHNNKLYNNCVHCTMCYTVDNISYDRNSINNIASAKFKSSKPWCEKNDSKVNHYSILKSLIRTKFTTSRVSRRSVTTTNLSSTTLEWYICLFTDIIQVLP